MPRTVVLVPTAHVLGKSVQDVERAIRSEKPDAIAIELDPFRYQSMACRQCAGPLDFLRHGQFFAAAMAFFQNLVARHTGVFPGAEMMKAVELAAANSIPVLFIDQPFPITLQKLSKVPLAEKLRLFTLFVSPMDLEALTEPETVSALLETLKSKAPTIHRILVEERDRYMAQALINNPFSRLVAVVGAGHLRGISIYLSALSKSAPGNYY